MLMTRWRHGASLVELLVVTAILGVAAGAVTRIATRQQHHYSRAAIRTLAEAQLREGAAVLTSELAGIAPGAGDIYDGGMGRSAIEFRSTLATAVLCAAPNDGAADVDLMPLAAGEGSDHRGDPVVNATALVAPGDSLWIHDARSDTAGSSTAWRAHLVIATARAGEPCMAEADSTSGLPVRATLTPTVAGLLEPHAPVRVFRRTRYALYTGSDGQPYLGFTDCRPVVRSPACSPLQPVAGPYLRAASPSAPLDGGLLLEYLDADGKPTDDRFAVAAITVHLRANGALPSQRPETVGVRRTVALRNAPR